MEYFWVILSIILVIMFIYSILTKQSNGTMHSTVWVKEQLKTHLFWLPIFLVLISVITLYYRMMMNTASGESMTLAVIELILCIAFLIWHFVFLNKTAESINKYIGLSILLSVFCAVLFWYSKLGYEEATNYMMMSSSPILGSLFVLTSYSDQMFEAKCMSAFVIILTIVLEFYYIRWMSFYYHQESVLGYSTSDNNQTIKTFDAQSVEETSSEETNSSLKAKSLQLTELKQLLDDGILTQEEFNEEKRKILN